MLMDSMTPGFGACETARENRKVEDQIGASADAQTVTTTVVCVGKAAVTPQNCRASTNATEREGMKCMKPDHANRIPPRLSVGEC
jgi:hypothetical protein